VYGRGFTLNASSRKLEKNPEKAWIGGRIQDATDESVPSKMQGGKDTKRNKKF